MIGVRLGVGDHYLLDPSILGWGYCPLYSRTIGWGLYLL